MTRLLALAALLALPFVALEAWLRGFDAGIARATEPEDRPLGD